MNGKCIGCIVGGIAIGAVAAVLYAKNKEKLKPMAAQLVAQGMKLKDKAAEYAATTKEAADEIVIEAKEISHKAKAKA